MFFRMMNACIDCDESKTVSRLGKYVKIHKSQSQSARRIIISPLLNNSDVIALVESKGTMWSVIWQWLSGCWCSRKKWWELARMHKCQRRAICSADQLKIQRFAALKFHSIAEIQYFVFEQALTTRVPTAPTNLRSVFTARKIFAEMFVIDL